MLHACGYGFQNRLLRMGFTDRYQGNTRRITMDASVNKPVNWKVPASQVKKRWLYEMAA